jgi:hypothetical protein
VAARVPARRTERSARSVPHVEVGCAEVRREKECTEHIDAARSERAEVREQALAEGCMQGDGHVACDGLDSKSSHSLWDSPLTSAEGSSETAVRFSTARSFASSVAPLHPRRSFPRVPSCNRGRRAFAPQSALVACSSSLPSASSLSLQSP